MATMERHSSPAQKTITFFKKLKSLIPSHKSKKRALSEEVVSTEKTGKKAHGEKPLHSETQKQKAHPHRRRKQNLKAKAQGHGNHQAKSRPHHQHSKPHAKKKEDSVAATSQNFSHVNPYHDIDRAHSPGHRKLNVRGEFQEPTGEKTQTQESAKDRMAPADQVHRVTSQDRSQRGNR
ncbi:MAG: hypothetical protein ACAH59_12000 [Pseudobdellovibrionaceae bacterium]